MPGWFHAGDSFIARLVLQRGLGVAYFIAFAVALEQFVPLLGERGLLPVPRFLERVRFWRSPSLFHLGYSDRLLRLVAAAGMALSLAIVLGLPDRWPALLNLASGWWSGRSTCPSSTWASPLAAPAGSLSSSGRFFAPPPWGPPGPRPPRPSSGSSAGCSSASSSAPG